MYQDNAKEIFSGIAHSDKLLSIIVPVFNEEEVLPEFHRRLTNMLTTLPVKSEVVYINDGSKDNTLDIMQDLRDKDSNVAVVDLSRNFGKEVALSAGLDYASGDAVIVIDADLQDPPELISEMVTYWQQGYDVVYARRKSREGETFMKRATAKAFYRLMQQSGRVSIPQDTGDFRLLSRKAVDALKMFREQHRFMKGLFSSIGFKQIPIEYNRDPRFAGKTKFNYWKLWNFALEGITSFTITPLKIASYTGIMIAFLAFLYGIFVIYKKIMFGDPVQGYASLMVVILFLGGIELIALGIIGEYIGRIFNETKQRPLYFINNYCPTRSSGKTSLHFGENTNQVERRRRNRRCP